MEKLVKKLRGSRPSIQSGKVTGETEMLNHVAWRGESSLDDVHSLLSGKEPFTYAFSQGIDRQHYFLSYVTPEGVVKCKNVRLVISASGPEWNNGGMMGRYESLGNLLLACLKVSEGVCKPLIS